MKITIVTGFFLPMPPVAGGAVEKSWHGLAQEFVAAGHEVTIVSRRWRDWPNDERAGGIRYLRCRGHDHTTNLAMNLVLDAWWSLRVWRSLPPADVTVVNCIALPVWLGWLRRRSGRLVVMPGRMPKGQFYLYRRLDRVLSVSETVRAATIAENAQLAPLTTITGYPISWRQLVAARSAASPTGGPITIGFIGRIHREKGLDLLAEAVQLLARRGDLPEFRVLLCGPTDVARGGSGPDYADAILQKLLAALPAERVSFLPPTFDAAQLARLYTSIDIFCYPSLATRGETFGVAVAEAMAAGAVPVVSRLPCFTDFVRPGVNGAIFDHTADDAAGQLAAALADLLGSPARRAAAAAAAQSDTQRYDYAEYARRLLVDFSTLKLPSAARNLPA